MAGNGPRSARRKSTILLVCPLQAEQDLEEWKQKAGAEEAFREKCERKANAEASLCKEWQEKALQWEQDMEVRFLKEFEEKLKVKDAQLAEALMSALAVYFRETQRWKKTLPKNGFGPPPLYDMFSTPHLSTHCHSPDSQRAQTRRIPLSEASKIGLEGGALYPDNPYPLN